MTGLRFGSPLSDWPQLRLGRHAELSPLPSAPDRGGTDRDVSLLLDAVEHVALRLGPLANAALKNAAAEPRGADLTPGEAAPLALNGGALAAEPPPARAHILALRQLAITLYTIGDQGETIDSKPGVGSWAAATRAALQGSRP